MSLICSLPQKSIFLFLFVYFEIYGKFSFFSLFLSLCMSKTFLETHKALRFLYLMCVFFFLLFPIWYIKNIWHGIWIIFYLREYVTHRIVNVFSAICTHENPINFYCPYAGYLLFFFFLFHSAHACKCRSNGYFQTLVPPVPSFIPPLLCLELGGYCIEYRFAWSNINLTAKPYDNDQYNNRF